MLSKSLECKNVEPYGLILNIHKSNVMVVVAKPPRVGSTYILVVLANMHVYVPTQLFCKKKNDILPFFNMTNQERNGLSILNRTSFPFVTNKTKSSVNKI
jgi:hypothetical protein